MRVLRSVFSIHPVSLTLGIIALVVVLFFSGSPILDLIELKTYDLRVLSRGQRQPSPTVVLALIDEKKPRHGRTLALAAVQNCGAGGQALSRGSQGDRF